MKQFLLYFSAILIIFAIIVGVTALTQGASSAPAAAHSALPPAAPPDTAAAKPSALPDVAEPVDRPLSVLADTARFVLYMNEEPLMTINSAWAATGALKADYLIEMAGQKVGGSVAIETGPDGRWTTMRFETPRGPVDATRLGNTVTVKALGQTSTLELRPGTIIFENYTPCLMSQAVAAYDEAKGGAQSFPIFIIPSIVMDASLERLETVERFIGGVPRNFTTYKYALPGVDLFLWVDEAKRVVYGDVPAQHAAYVREGYEGLRAKETTDPLLSQPTHEVTVDKNVMVKMRDGTKLATDIYRPAGEGRWPVILTRTPYGKDMSELTGRYYARRGYVYAVQDCRGRFASKGKWNPFFNEPKDGYDTIEWLAVQPWSTGKVGMIGASYLGWVQWWAAREAPPHLAAMIPNVSPPDPYFNMPYEYGSFFLLGAIWWANILESEATADLSGKAFAKVNDARYTHLLRQLPVIDLDKKILGKKNKYWREWIAHPDNDQWWAKASFLDKIAGLDIPVYHQSGWYDGDAIGTKLNCLAMSKGGAKNQRIVVGPWGHSDTAHRMGQNEVDFGPNAIVDLHTSYVRWMDRWLKGIDNGIDREPLASLFVMGTNAWLTGAAYPLPETKFTKFYLASSGSANSSKGDGRLTMTPPAPPAVPGAVASLSDAFVYDPGDPTPDPRYYFEPEDTLAKPTKDTTAVSVDAKRAEYRAFYGKINEERKDILVYDTEPLKDSLTLAGPVSAVIYASSSAKDTDWFVRLSEVDEKGIVFPLVHGTIRARYRESFSTPTLLKPGEIYEYKIDMWHTGITVPPGRRLRVEVASASFPMFSRNLNTGGHNETGWSFVKASQRVYHDVERPSHVLLPVIEKPAFKAQPW